MKASGILEAAYPDLLVHFTETLPQEAVGFVMRNGCVLRLINQARSEHRFFINRAQVKETLSNRGLKVEDVFCVYHTHPSRPVRPSPEDQRFMLDLAGPWPHAVHLILSRDESAVYAVVDGKIERLPWQRNHSLPVS